MDYCSSTISENSAEIFVEQKSLSHTCIAVEVLVRRLVLLSLLFINFFVGWSHSHPSVQCLLNPVCKKEAINALDWPIETTRQATWKERNRHMEDEQNETERQSVRVRDRENVGPENLNLIQFFNLKMS